MDNTQLEKGVEGVRALRATDSEKKQIKEFVLSSTVQPRRFILSPYGIFSLIRHNFIVDNSVRAVAFVTVTAGKPYFFVRKVFKNIFSSIEK